MLKKQSDIFRQSSLPPSAELESKTSSPETQTGNFTQSKERLRGSSARPSILH
jgi:hypothetical protein